MAIQRPKLKFQRGSTYIIDLSDASNAGHPLRFTADSGSTEYSHGVTVTGTPGQAGAKVTFNVPDSAPENLMYYCSTHGIGMGNKIKTFSGPLGTIDEAAGSGSLGMQVGSSNSQWFEFNGDGTALYVHNVGSGSLAPAGHLLNKYTLSTPYDLTTATYSNDVYYGSGNDYEGKFSGDGMRFYYNSGSGWMHNLSTAYEPGTNIRAAGEADGAGPGGESWCFSHDGYKLYTLAKSNIPNGVVYSEGTTAWDTSTFSLPGGGLTGNTFDYGNEMSGASNIEMNSTGTKLYIYTRYSSISGAPIAIVEYDFTTAYDITTLTYNGKYLNVGSDGFQSAERISFRLENDNLIFVKGPNTNHSGNDAIYQYTIPSAGSGSGTGTAVFTWGGARGFILGGITQNPTAKINNIEYWTIATPGNATDFGDLTTARQSMASMSSGTRGIVAGGYESSVTVALNEMQYITCATPGNGTDFGDLTWQNFYGAGHSNGTKGFYSGGQRASEGSYAYVNTIDQITIATTGNATDTADLTVARAGGDLGVNDATRAVHMGGQSATQREDTIDYFSMDTTSNAVDFGDMASGGRVRAASGSDVTYGILAGGRRTGSSNANDWTENIDYITIQTTGNSSDFGDLTTFYENMSGASDNTYMTMAGAAGNDGVSNVRYNVIERITIATPGNSADFGDLTQEVEQGAGLSGNAA